MKDLSTNELEEVNAGTAFTAGSSHQNRVLTCGHTNCVMYTGHMFEGSYVYYCYDCQGLLTNTVPIISLRPELVGFQSLSQDEYDPLFAEHGVMYEYSKTRR